jgi:predicted transcriptional regulator
MDVIYRHGSATAAEVKDGLPDAPSYSAVRAMLRILEEKGHLTHSKDGPRYVYEPTVAPDKARRTALRHLVRTFFDDSAGQAVATLLDVAGDDLSDDELNRLASLIEHARNEGR